MDVALRLVASCGLFREIRVGNLHGNTRDMTRKRRSQVTDKLEIQISKISTCRR